MNDIVAFIFDVIAKKDSRESQSNIHVEKVEHISKIDDQLYYITSDDIKVSNPSDTVNLDCSNRKQWVDSNKLLITHSIMLDQEIDLLKMNYPDFLSENEDIHDRDSVLFALVEDYNQFIVKVNLSKNTASPSESKANIYYLFAQMALSISIGMFISKWVYQYNQLARSKSESSSTLVDFTQANLSLSFPKKKKKRKRERKK